MSTRMGFRMTALANLMGAAGVEIAKSATADRPGHGALEILSAAISISFVLVVLLALLFDVVSVSVRLLRSNEAGRSRSAWLVYLELLLTITVSTIALELFNRGAATVYFYGLTAMGAGLYLVLGHRLQKEAELIHIPRGLGRVDLPEQLGHPARGLFGDGRAVVPVAILAVLFASSVVLAASGAIAAAQELLGNQPPEGATQPEAESPAEPDLVSPETEERTFRAEELVALLATIEEGDTMWGITKEYLEETTGTAPSDAEIVLALEEVKAVNSDRLRVPGNFDLIFPGDGLQLPERR